MSPPVLWDGKESACNSRDPVLIPGSGRSPGEGHDNWLQYSCLENPMDRVVWWAAAHGVPKSQTGLSDWAHTHTAPPGMAESLRCSPETIKALLIGYTPIQNKKFLKRHIHTSVQFSSVQLLSCVWLFVIPAHQASLSISNSQSVLKLMSIESVMPSNHLILCHPSTFNLSQHQGLFQWISSGGQSFGVSASASVLPMIIQDWFPLGWTG